MSLSELKTQVRIQKLDPSCSGSRKRDTSPIDENLGVRVIYVKLKHKDTEISKLQAALRLFINNNTSQEPIKVDDEQDELVHSGGEDEEMDIDGEEDQEQDEDNEPLKPLFDDQTGLYFCTDCLAEIEEGFCIACGDKYEWQEEDPLRNTESTENQAIHYDRSLVPRGNTPLLPDSLFDRYPPLAEYRSREGEYKELLRRGATRIMCETFHLEFSLQGGIYAWADPQLFEESAGPAMKKGDFWKIHLGRRVSLDQDDEDGSAFIDGLRCSSLTVGRRLNVRSRNGKPWKTHLVYGSPVSRPIEIATLESKNFDSDDEDRSEDIENAHENEDMALENPPTEDTDPIRADNYTFSDSEEEEDKEDEDETVDDEDDDEDDEDDEEDDEDKEDEEDEEDEDEDMGAYITAQDPDGVWEPYDEDWEEDGSEMERPFETS